MTVNKLTYPAKENAVQEKINEIIDNMAGTITVDQTYDGTSSNPQSGVAINGAKFIQNTATGTDSITIGGTANSNTTGINIGVGSLNQANNSVAIGYSAHTTIASGSIAIGSQTTTAGQGAIAIGTQAEANASFAIQLGYGTNSTANSFQVGSYQLLNTSTGKIPNDRLNLDQTYDGTSTNAQSGVAIAGELANYSNTNLSNITNTGKIAIAHNAMPTTSEVVVSSIANGGTYIAPHDGYLIATGKQVVAGGGFVQLSGNAVSSSWIGSGMTGNYTYTTIPVKKGLTVTVYWYGFTGGVSLNFAPCIGSENEV